MEIDIVGNDGDGLTIATCSNSPLGQFECGVETLQIDIHKSGSCLQAGTNQFKAVQFTNDDVSGSRSGCVNRESAKF